MINKDKIPRDVFVLGGSAGGIEALSEILRRLPQSPSVTIGVAIHRPAVGEGNLRRVLGHFSPLPVTEPADGDAVQPGVVCLAPKDFHLLLRNDHWQVTRGPKVHRSRPAVDPLFVSAADSRQKRVVGILLSGAGSDGVIGLIAIKAAGGVTIVQDPREAEVASMPSHALREDDVDAAMTVAGIAAAIPALALGQSVIG
jgi:two-component system, chemotaxis family, protein-glutamate methylesterase/glutaminase